MSKGLRAGECRTYWRQGGGGPFKAGSLDMQGAEVDVALALTAGHVRLR